MHFSVELINRFGKSPLAEAKVQTARLRNPAKDFLSQWAVAFSLTFVS
jgi:hypothetical protein